MTLTLAPDHDQARQEAARLPALHASFVRLIYGAGVAHVALYTGSDPDSGTLLASVLLPGDAVALDEPGLRIVITGAEGLGMVNGVAGCARIFDADGRWWADASVSDQEGDAVIQLENPTILPGAFVRLFGEFTG